MLMSSSILPKKPRRISGTTTQPYIKYKKTKVMLTYKYGQNAVDQMSHGFSYFPILGRHTSHHVSLFPYRIRGFGVIQLAGNVSRIHIFMAVPFRTHSWIAFSGGETPYPRPFQRGKAVPIFRMVVLSSGLSAISGFTIFLLADRQPAFVHLLIFPPLGSATASCCSCSVYFPQFALRS